MSIKYNGKTIAGNYKISASTTASDTKAGPIKIATEQELQDTTNNKVAVTPYLLNKALNSINRGLKIGRIGIGFINESQQQERYLNGQTIIQDQFESFTTWVKDLIKLYPNLSCTNEEFENACTLSAFGQCGKFVVDDGASTIRLPKIVNIQGLFDLSQAGLTVEAGLPNITGSFNPVGSNGDTVLWHNNSTTNGAFTKINSGTKILANAMMVTTANSQSLGFDASRSSSVYKNGVKTVQPEAVQYPYWIQVATGVETEDNITNTIELNNPFFFGMSQYFEVEPNNLSWLKSVGQYNPKATYPSYYDWLLTGYNNPNIPNVDVIGTPTFNNGAYSNFATANYVRIPETFTNTSKPWEFIVPLKISSFGTNQYIFCSESYGFGLNVGADGKLQTYISSNGTSWNINSGRVSSLTIALNTQYYIKTAWTGTQYVVSVSTDKKSYTTYITVDSTSPIAPSLFKFGTGRATAGQSLLYGEINIFEASLTSNGNVWWKGLSVKNIKMSTEAYTDYDWVINSADETFRLPLLDGSESLVNYSRVQSIQTGFIAPYNGLIYANNGALSNATAILFVNGIDVGRSMGGATVQDVTSMYALVKRGDVITFDNMSIANYYPMVGNGSLYFYVGETVQNANLINAGRVEEKLVSLNDVVHKDLLADRQTVVGWVEPDYENGVTLPLAAIGTYNWVFMPCTALVHVEDTANQDRYIYVSKNKSKILIKDHMCDGANGTGHSSGSLIVPKGYYVACMAISGTAKYFPLKGVK